MSKFILDRVGSHRELIAVSSIIHIEETGDTCNITVKSIGDETSTGIPYSMDEVIAFLKSDEPILE